MKIRLKPLGDVFDVPAGTPLRDILFNHGVEFPCGGRGHCRKCRVRVLEGTLPAGEDEKQILTPEEVREGWRLACRSAALADITLDIAQWEAAILADDSVFPFTPREGLGVAVDLGTTTLVAQLLDLATGHVLGVRTALNPQAAHGSDVMSRVHMAVAGGGLAELTRLIRVGISSLIRELRPPSLQEVVIVGNTVMHHLLCGIDPEPLSHYPFQPVDDGLKTFGASELGWRIASDPMVQFLPCLGGFVGSDILAGILATGLDRSDSLAGLFDLGTNGEIVFGNKNGIMCASTAAGPAFEGGRISIGMRAATGAITEVTTENGSVRCHVLGDGAPRGICGSGLVDAVAAGLALGRIQPSGRLAGGAKEWPLADGMKLLQRDIRELQLAKAAIAAGARILLSQFGAAAGQLRVVHLAGAFGNYVNRASARRIGLLDFPLDKVEPAGNTALLGAKLALFSPPEQRGFEALRRKVKHVPLASDREFEEIYVDSMSFPAGFR